MLNLQEALIATLFIMLVTILERAFPFILFSRKNPPKIINFIEKYIPPMVMAALLFYCIKDISFVSNGTVDLKGFLPYTIGIGATVINCVEICEDAYIGAGAVVIDDIKENGTYVGVPAKKIR